MDCGFNINHVLPDEFTIVDASADFWKNTSVGGGREFMRQEINTIIDRIGEGSAQIQGLLTPITSSAKLRASDHKLYILKDATANQYRGGVIGFIKTARKKLILFDAKGGKKQYEPVCILDFFIDPAYQRQGNGTKLLNYVLQREHIQSQDIAIDRPSAKCLSFFARKYNLFDIIKQPSNFAVFTDFFANNAGVDLDVKENGSELGTAEKYQNGLARSDEKADAAGRGTEPYVNGRDQLTNGQNGKLQNGDSNGAAGTGSYKPGPIEGAFRGALRQTKGPNLHYVHTQLW
jgi:alpha-tubulin N-acetyltransferase 1